MNLRKHVKLSLVATNLVLALLLIVSAYAHLIDPNDFLITAFLGLAFLPILLLNLVFMVFWLFAKPMFGFIGLIAISLSWGTTSKHFSLWPETHPSEGGVSVMSFNVRLFDLYNWGGNKVARDEIFNYLEDKNPSILCFQEFFHTNDPRYFNTLDTLVEFLDATEVHDYYTAVIHGGKSKFGIATMSKFPIVNKGIIPLDNSANNAAIYSDILVEGETIRVFNIHLASVHISGLQNDLSKHFEADDKDAQMKDLELITKRLSSGFKRRAMQVKTIRSHIDASPYPVIVCGDLNDTPGSYAYNCLSRGLTDAFLALNTGVGSTYLGLVPMLRIDYILVDPRLSLLNFSTEAVDLSDHKPLLAGFQTNK